MEGWNLYVSTNRNTRHQSGLWWGSVHAQAANWWWEFEEEKMVSTQWVLAYECLVAGFSSFLKWIAYWENVDWVISSQLHLDLSVKLIFFAIFVLSRKDFRVFINVKPSHWPFPLQEMFSILCHYSCYFSERVKKYFL